MDRRSAIAERAARLKLARENAGYTSPRKAAEALGWNQNTYRAHESGANGFENDTGQKYAQGFRVDFGWLMTGEGESEAPVATLRAPIVGIVGTDKNGLITPVTPGTPREVELPFVTTERWEGLYVGGDALKQVHRRGRILLYRPVLPADLSTITGHECVVVLPDGRRFLKYVHPDERVPGRWTLSSDFVFAMTNQELSNVYPIRLVQVWGPISPTNVPERNLVDSQS